MNAKVQYCENSVVNRDLAESTSYKFKSKKETRWSHVICIEPAVRGAECCTGEPGFICYLSHLLEYEEMRKAMIIIKYLCLLSL